MAGLASSRAFFVASVVFLAFAAGCSGSTQVDPAVLAAQRKLFVLAEEPDGAQTVLDVRQALSGEDAEKRPKEIEVVVVGLVGGTPNPSEQSQPEFPFVKNRAMFFLADPEAVAEHDEHAHHHAPGEECAFCKAHADDMAHALAAIQFKDQSGKVPAVDVRQLFDLEEQDAVVVRGVARLAEGGSLVVDATGLYVRR